MALLDRLRSELVDIVEWVDDSEHTLVWRFPRYRNEIKYSANLIVRPGQTAVFVHQGRIADVFEPGHYALETKNLPILSTLMGWKHGFESPFKSEIYFVSTKQLTGLKWGTSNPVPMRDADFGPVRVRAFGTYTLRAIDPARLLSELVGTDGVYEADEISSLLRSIIAMAFADTLASSGISVLDLAQNYTELSETLRQEVVSRIDDEYGLELPQLFIVNVSVPAEVEQALDTRASMNAIGDMGAFQAYQLGQAMPEAAANPAGGLAGAGVGLGMGLAMTNSMGGILGGGGGGGQGGAPSPNAPVSPPPLSPTVAWHFAENGQAVGPVTGVQLAQAVRDGRVDRASLVWCAGMSEWAAAGQVEALNDVFAAMPPPVPGSPAPDA